MTLQESVKLEEAIGSDKAAALFGGAGEIAVTPSLIRTLIWIKLQKHVPGLALDGFDIPLGAFNSIDTGGGSVIEMPMTTPDGDTETVQVKTGTDSGNG